MPLGIVSTSRRYDLARVLDVHDGDTLKIDVDLGFSCHTWVWVRLKGVGAPELSEPDGLTARSDVQLWLAEHASDMWVSLTTFQTAGTFKEIRERRTFIRYVGIVIADNGAELNSYLLAKGYVDRGA
jgi:endonuclease YncB( thermonuclease family)